MKNYLKKNNYLIIPAVLTVLLLLIVYIIKGVYPFGTSNIAYYDMNQGYVPGFSRIYEIFHGKDSMIFDWLEGAGMDMTSTFQFVVLQPLNWFFIFLKPDYVLDFMAWLLIIKLVLISLSISFYIKKTYNMSLMIHIVLSMMYTFSGYILQYYTNIWWLETVAIFPWIVLSLRSMMQDGKYVFFLGLLTFELATCQYMSFMVLMFVLFYSFGLSFVEEDKVKRRKFVTKLGVTTLISLSISAVLLLPALVKWTKISRTSGSHVGLLTIFGFPISDFQHQKLFMLFNTEFAVALFGVLIISVILKKRKFPRETVFKLYTFFIMLMPVLNEGTNILWHMGSYMHFPFRCAFMLTFTGIDLIAYVWNEYGNDPIFRIHSKDKQIVIGVIATMIAFASMVIGINLYVTFIEYGIQGRAVSYYGLSEMLVLNVILYLLVIFFFNKKIRERVFCIVTITHLTIASVCFIAPTDYYKQDDFSYYVMRDKFIHDSIEIRNNAELENDYVSRIKTLYPCLSRNYALMLGIPSITQFMSEPVAEFLDELNALGYDVNYTTNLDSGGTYFSDAVLNDKKIIVYGDVYVPKRAYSKDAVVEDYTIYDMNYTLPFGMLVDERIMATNCDKITKAEHQIQVAEALADDIKIFNLIDSSKAELLSSNPEDKEYKYRYKISVDSPSLLYICTKRAYHVSVNEQKAFFPFFDDLINTQFKKNTCNNLRLITEFDKNEVANIDITLSSDKIDEVQLVMLDLDAMEKLSDKYETSSVSSYKVGDNKLDMTADVDGNNYLFLPLEYLDGWHAKVNGNEAEILPVMNSAFMAVKLPDGHCEINMTFMPPTIIKGAVISLIGFAVAAVLFIMKRRGKDIAEIPLIAKTASVVFNITAVAVLIVMYVLPVFI
ncbi:MAG: YfhO family protein [Oscillospiraceae bacterium]|nr:YfhO family protein [Oscillospiraceae bacterium]